MLHFGRDGHSGSEKLPAIVRFALLRDKGFLIEPSYKRHFKQLNYAVTNNTEEATFILTKQDDFAKLGRSGHYDRGLGICEEITLMRG